jgi:hypothetical protein
MIVDARDRADPKRQSDDISLTTRCQIHCHYDVGKGGPDDHDDGSDPDEGTP